MIHVHSLGHDRRRKREKPRGRQHIVDSSGGTLEYDLDIIFPFSASKKIRAQVLPLSELVELCSVLSTYARFRIHAAFYPAGGFPVNLSAIPSRRFFMNWLSHRQKNGAEPRFHSCQQQSLLVGRRPAQPRDYAEVVPFPGLQTTSSPSNSDSVSSIGRLDSVQVVSPDFATRSSHKYSLSRRASRSSDF
jgi:hypothetical protein